jgi:hypothetical protein
MRVQLASILSFVLVAGCNTSTPMPMLHLDGGSGSKDMAMGNGNQDLTMNQGGPDLTMMAAGPCDLIKQDCTDQTNSKCAAVDDGTGMSLTSMCVMPTGTKMTEDPCTRINNMSSGEGYDDCAKGNYCSGLGTLSMPPVRHCRNFCLLDTDCKNSEHCVGLIVNQAMNAFTMGLCAPTCTPFGTDCGQGLNCSNLLPAIDMSQEFVACRQPGQVGTSGACTSDSDCVADAVCVTPMMGANPICSALCDMASHTCANGKTCTPLTMGSMFGACL